MEIGIRIGFSLSLNTWILDGEKIILRNYPELRFLFEKKTENSHPRVLILGGSAVHTSFCNLDYLLNSSGKKFQVDTLAQYAQNSLDSWYKYRLLRAVRYDYIFFYHGINDTRTNNCPSEVFDEDYRHISFYNEVYVYFRHPEIRFCMSFWFLDFLWQKLAEVSGIRKTIPKEYNIMEFYFEKKAPADPWWKYGAEIKSVKSFSRNLENILQLASNKKEKVIVMSYAFFLPDDYSLEKFLNKELGYTGHEWPVEIYGEPKNVKTGIIAHNEAGARIVKKYPEHIHLDFANQIQREGKFFRDICHLTPDGCEEMGKLAYAALSH